MTENTESKELQQVLWDGANILRGKMDANEYKKWKGFDSDTTKYVNELNKMEADNVALKSKSTVSFTLADGAINPENNPAARQLNTSIPDSVYYTDATASKKVSFSYAGITLNVTSWGPCSTSGYGDYYVSRLPSIEMACIKTMTHADYIKLI